MITVSYHLVIDDVHHRGELTFDEPISIGALKESIKIQLYQLYNCVIPLKVLTLCCNGNIIHSDKQLIDFKKINFSLKISNASEEQFSSVSSSSRIQASLVEESSFIPKKLSFTVPIITSILHPIEEKKESSIEKMDEHKFTGSIIDYIFLNACSSVGEKRIIAWLSEPHIRKQVDLEKKLPLILMNLAEGFSGYICNEVLDFLVCKDEGYKQQIDLTFLVENKFDITLLKLPAFQKRLPELIHTKEDLDAVVSSLFKTSEYGVLSLSMARGIFLGYHPSLRYLVLDSSPVEMGTKIIEGSVAAFPTVIARLTAEYGLGDYAPNTPHFFAFSWTFLNVRSLSFGQDNIEGKSSSVCICLPKENDNFLLELYFRYDYKPEDYINYLAGLKKLAADNIVQFHNGTLYPYSNPDDISSSADIGTIVDSSQTKPHSIRIIFKTPRGLIAGSELALQIRILSRVDHEWLSHYITQQYGQDAFKQAVIMICFSRAIQDPTMDLAIVPLMPVILEFMASDRTPQLAFNPALFFQSVLFRIHANDKMLSEEEYKKKAELPQSYLNSRLSFLSSHQQADREMFEIIDRASVKSKNC